MPESINKEFISRTTQFSRTIEAEERSADSKNEVTAVVSAEVEDSYGTIIKVGGIDLSRYGDRPVPILASHAQSLSNGEPPVIGYSTKIWRSTIQVGENRVSALKINWQWLDTPLAQTWRKVHDAHPDLCQYSIAGQIQKATPSKGKNDPRTGYIDSIELYEISLVAVGSNPLTGSNRSTEEEMLKEISKRVAELASKMSSVVEANAVIEQRLDEIAASQTTVISRSAAHMAEIDSSWATSLIKQLRDVNKKANHKDNKNA